MDWISKIVYNEEDFFFHVGQNVTLLAVTRSCQSIVLKLRFEKLVFFSRQMTSSAWKRVRMEIDKSFIKKNTSQSENWITCIMYKKQLIINKI